MTIVRATSGQAESIATIISRSNQDVAEMFGLNRENNPKHPSFCNQDWVISDFSRGEEYFIYREGALDVGCVAFEKARPEVAYLNRLSVLPEYRHQDIGARLVQHVLHHAHSQNIPRISLGIIAKHSQLKHWYLKLGFVEGETRSFPHLPFDVLYMYYDL